MLLASRHLGHLGLGRFLQFSCTLSKMGLNQRDLIALSAFHESKPILTSALELFLQQLHTYTQYCHSFQYYSIHRHNGNASLNFMTYPPPFSTVFLDNLYHEACMACFVCLFSFSSNYAISFTSLRYVQPTFSSFSVVADIQ